MELSRVSRDPLAEHIAQQTRAIDEGPGRKPWHRFDAVILALAFGVSFAGIAIAGGLVACWIFK
jgi:hypothetical protein